MSSTRWLAVAILSVFGVFAFLGGPEAEAQSYEAAEVEVIELINAYRQENGLGTVSLSAPLSVASERHSEDMGTYGFFAHDTAQSSYYQPGWGHSERIAQEGYDYDTFTAENLAFGQATAQEAFEAWRNSPSHNEAMLGDYSVVGVGLVNVGGVPYWTTVFGAEVDPSAQPVGAAPSSDDAADSTVEDPTAQADQYETEPQDDTATEEQYDNAAAADDEVGQPAAAEQYDAPDASAETAADEQYDPEQTSEQPAADEQYDGDANVAPGSGTGGTSAAEQYQANAERFQAAADQYGEESRQAEAEIAALQAEQSQPTTATQAAPANAPASSPPAADTQAAPANTPAASPSSAADTQAAPAPASVGAVSSEPQVSAPASAEQEIPVPSVENGATAVQSQSAGQSGGETSEGSGESSEQPSEAMASIGMTVLPDTGGLPVGGIGAILGASLVVCLLATTRKLLG